MKKTYFFSKRRFRIGTKAEETPRTSDGVSESWVGTQLKTFEANPSIYTRSGKSKISYLKLTLNHHSENLIQKYQQLKLHVRTKILVTPMGSFFSIFAEKRFRGTFSILEICEPKRKFRLYLQIFLLNFWAIFKVFSSCVLESASQWSLVAQVNFRDTTFSTWSFNTKPSLWH